MDYILKNAFNFKMVLPSSLYDKRDSHPVVEAILDLAMLALIREKYLATDVLWWPSPSPSGGMFVFSFQRFRESSELVRQFVLQTNFPKGLRA